MGSQMGGKLGDLAGDSLRAIEQALVTEKDELEAAVATDDHQREQAA